MSLPNVTENRGQPQPRPFGTSSSYDLCGNMASRGTSGGTQALTYDEENRLTQVSGAGGPTVNFGYSGGGNRLWRWSSASGSYSIWIGGIYEERSGKVLCHVFAGGRRIATLEPQAGSYVSAGQKDKWAMVQIWIDRAFTWPLAKGRAPWTFLFFTMGGLFGICLAANRQLRNRASSRWRFIRKRPMWQGAVSLVSLLALLLATTPTEVSAQTYSPIFYYYHPDHLGSTTVLTDRSGNRVDLYQNTAFGREQYNDPTAAFAMSNRYTGQVQDDETGLYYYNARYYDPELGRFVQPDTIIPGAGNPQNLNRYSYCGNNPLNEMDPSGHGGFFGGLFSSIGHAFSDTASNPQSLANLVSGGPIGAFMLADGAAHDYVNGQLFGKETASYMGTARSVVIALAEIVGGIYSGNYFAVASGALSLASIGAGLAGDQQLSSDLGWAAFGTATLGTIVSLYQAAQSSNQGSQGTELAVDQSDAPQYDPSGWGSDTNCYNYALDRNTGDFLQVGKLGGTSPESWTVASFDCCAQKDGLLPARGAIPAGYSHRVQLYIGDIKAGDGTLLGQDFHWFREDRNGFWSQKHGGDVPTNLDGSNRLIQNPLFSDRTMRIPNPVGPGSATLNYNRFVGEYWVPSRLRYP